MSNISLQYSQTRGVRFAKTAAQQDPRPSDSRTCVPSAEANTPYAVENEYKNHFLENKR